MKIGRLGSFMFTSDDARIVSEDVSVLPTQCHFRQYFCNSITVTPDVG